MYSNLLVSEYRVDSLIQEGLGVAKVPKLSRRI
jgi:hypothetical protein